MSLKKYCTELKPVTAVKRISICCGHSKAKSKGSRICPLGDAATLASSQAIRHFRDEFEYHVRFPEKIKNRDHYVAEPFEKVKHLVAKQTV